MAFFFFCTYMIIVWKTAPVINSVHVLKHGIHKPITFERCVFFSRFIKLLSYVLQIVQYTVRVDTHTGYTHTGIASLFRERSNETNCWKWKRWKFRYCDKIVKLKRVVELFWKQTCAVFFKIQIYELAARRWIYYIVTYSKEQCSFVYIIMIKLYRIDPNATRFNIFLRFVYNTRIYVYIAIANNSNMYISYSNLYIGNSAIKNHILYTCMCVWVCMCGVCVCMRVQRIHRIISDH